MYSGVKMTRITATQLIKNLKKFLYTPADEALQELKILNLDDKQFEEILALLCAQNLSHAVMRLDISDNEDKENNRISKIPSNIGNFRALQILNFANCNLQNFP